MPSDNSIQFDSNIETIVSQQKKDYVSIFKNDKGFSSVAGIRHYKRSNKLDFKLHEQVYLVPEPDNRYDKNAIKVITGKGIKIGYIPRYENKEILELIEEGYHFNANISIINLDEPDYPFAMIEISRTKTPQAIPFTDKEILELDNKSVRIEKKYLQDSKKSYELTKKGLELEKTKDIEEAIKYFEEAIQLPKTPPVAFNRLVVFYRKNKDYSNEIRVLNKNIESVLDSKANEHIKKDEIRKIKERIKKSEALSQKLN